MTDPSKKRSGAGGLPPVPLLDVILRNPDILYLDERRDAYRKKRREGKIFSRSLVGQYLPGDYYFVTFTSSKQSVGTIISKWGRLTKWLKRKYLGIVWLYCFTTEGLGVLHMLWRLSKNSPQPKKDDIETYWQKAHNAFTWISKAFNDKGLANYISEQAKRRKGMAGEMMQRKEPEKNIDIIKWRMGAGWVPVGFMKAFGRFYFNYGSDLDDHAQREAVRDWIIECKNDPKMIKYSPYIKGDVLHWSTKPCTQT